MKKSDALNGTKSKVLNAACKVILEKGAEALTLEAVAQKAGVSKGGLLYHFPSKNKLVEGMIGHLIAEVQDLLNRELEINGGDFLQAYINMTYKENPDHNTISQALFAALASDPGLLKPVQYLYLEWQNRAVAAASTPEIGTIVRLAMDGLWFADLLNLAPPPPEIRKAIPGVLLSIIQRSK